MSSRVERAGSEHLGVELTIRDGVVRLYARVEGEVFLSNCVRLPRADFRALLDALHTAFARLEDGDATGSPA